MSARRRSGFDYSGAARHAEYEREEAMRRADRENGNADAFCRNCGAHYTEAGNVCESDGDHNYPHAFGPVKGPPPPP